MTNPVSTASTSQVRSAVAPCTTRAGLLEVDAPLLPEPQGVSGDAIVALLQLFAEGNRQETQGAKTEVVVRAAEKQRHRLEQQAAIERARKVQEESGGFFDSLGIGSLVGIVTANPVLVVADMSMHMARLTPDFVRDFEKENKDSIELATKLYSAAGNAAILVGGGLSPESLHAAIALGGLLVQESGVLGKDASDWAGTGMVLAGSRDGSAAAAVVVADKDSAVADDIRTVERETKEYTKWAAVAGMAIAGTAAIIGSLGTATAPVVIIGVALSASGFGVTETKCLDPLLGEDASMWIGSGMMFAGAVISGAGAAEVAQNFSHTARSLTLIGEGIDSAAKFREGLEAVQTAAVGHEADEHYRVAQKHAFDAQRLQRVVEDILDSVRELKDSYRRVSQAANEAIQTQCQTQLMAATMRG